MIDQASVVVIGENAIIEDDVSVLHGVTLEHDEGDGDPPRIGNGAQAARAIDQVFPDPDEDM